MAEDTERNARETIAARISGLEDRITSEIEILSALNSALHNGKSWFQRFEFEIPRLDEQVGELDDRIKQLEERIAELERGRRRRKKRRKTR